MLAHRGATHSLVDALGVDSGQALEGCVDHDGYGVVAYHAVVFRPPQLPDGQIAIDVVLAQHALDHIAHSLGLEQCIKRVAGTEGVPEREGAVVGLALGQTRVGEVGAGVGAVDIGDGVGLDIGVVEAGVEDGLLVVGAVDAYVGELLLPGCHCLLLDSLETPSRVLGLHVLAGIVYAHGRERHLDDEGLARRAEVEEAAGVAAVGHVAVYIDLLTLAECLCHYGA